MTVMEINRKPNWQQLLSRYIVASRDRTFKYGTHDCCTFVCGAVEAMTGVDPMAEFRGTYDDLKSYRKMLKETGWGTLEAIFNAKFPEQPLSRVRRGDLIAFSGCFGVVLGGKALFVSDSDLEIVSVRECDRAWRIGHG